MNGYVRWLVQHPRTVGVVVAAVAAFVAWDAYDIGRRVQALRYFDGEAARAASEALGG
jgi:hypothetical protein